MIFNFHFGKTLRSSSHAVVVRRDRQCPELCPVRAMQEYFIVTKSVGWNMREGYLFPEVNADASRGSVQWPAARMTATLQAHIRAGRLQDAGGQYTMHSFRVGGAVSQSLAGTAVEALMDFVGWKTKGVAKRYVGSTTQEGGASSKRPRVQSCLLYTSPSPRD